MMSKEELEGIRAKFYVVKDDALVTALREISNPEGDPLHAMETYIAADKMITRISTRMVYGDRRD